MFEDSVTYVAVLTIANGLSDGDAIGDLPDGSGGFFLEQDAIGGFGYEEDTALAAGSKYVFAWRDADGSLHKSPLFDGGDVFNETFLADFARTEQITYLGYNGTSGSMDDSDSTYFGLKVILKHTAGTLNNSPLIRTIPFKTASSSSQEDLALGLTLAGDKAFRRGRMNRDVIFDAVCNVAVTAANCFDNNATITNGAKTFTVGTNLQYNTAAGTLAVGDYVRLGGTAKTAAATSLTSAVYKVTAIDTLTVTVDRPINVASGTYTAAGDMAEVITSATGLAADWGVRMDGNTPDEGDFVGATDSVFQVMFDVASDDFNTAEVTYSTAPVLGSGLEDQIRYLQSYAQFQDKDRIVSAYPPNVRIDEAVAGETYDIYSFECHESNYASATTGHNPISKWRMIIALDDDLSTDNTNFDAVLGVS